MNEALSSPPRAGGGMTGRAGRLQSCESPLAVRSAV